MPSTDRENLTRQIRDGVDIVDLIGGYVTLQRAGKDFKARCPFHEEKTPSFYVSPTKQIFKCYGCGAGGDIFTFVQLRERVEFIEARRMLAERAGIALDEDRFAAGGFGKSQLARVNQWAAEVFRRNFVGATGEAARAYVSGRGISPASVQAWKLGLAVDSFDSLLRQAGQARIDTKLLVAAGLIKERSSGGFYDTFRNRLMFPIADAGGRLIGFGGRTLGDDPAKYLNTPATALFDKSSNLYGLDKARNPFAKTGRAIIVEGYTDCIMAHQFGFTEAVATLGTAMTDAHASLLRRYVDRVILLFDSDEAGQKAADRALSVTLSGGLEVSLARVPQGKDPCDYLLSAGQLAFEQVLKGAVPALEFKWNLVTREYEAGSSGPARRRAIEAYLQLLSGWVARGAVDAIQVGLLVNQLGKMLSLPPQEVHRRLRGAGTPVRKIQCPSTTQPATRKTDLEQEALRQLLEVVLNDVQFYPKVEGWLRPSRFEDAALSQVASALVELLEADEPFRLDALIGRLQLPAFATLITDLQARGERRGGYEAVIEAAVNCLESAERARQTARLTDLIRGGAVPDEVDAPKTEEERLLALHETAGRPSFSSPRARRKFLER